MNIHRQCCLAGVLLVFGALAGCGDKTSSASKTTAQVSSDRPPMAQSDSQEFHHDDPCSLIEPRELEAVFGGPLGTAPYRGSNGNPQVDGSDCIYLSANFQQIVLSVAFEGGQRAYHVVDFVGNIVKSAAPATQSAKKAMISEDGSEITGEWDEAKLTPFNCCIFNALRADQLITVDFTGSRATLKQVARLVDAAFRRIDKPLSLDGGANVTAAKTFLSTRPARKDPCSVLTRAEAEAILGARVAEPVAKGDTCSYELPSSKGMPQAYQLEFRWRGGNYEFRSQLQAAKMGGVALGTLESKETTEQRVPDASSDRKAGTGSTAQPDPAGPGYHTVKVTETVTVEEAAKRVTGQGFSEGAHLTGDEDPTASSSWERSASIGPKFYAVGKDVAISCNTQFVDAGKARALVAAAMKKL
jgi:hypothetical protein